MQGQLLTSQRHNFLREKSLRTLNVVAKMEISSCIGFPVLIVNPRFTHADLPCGNVGTEPYVICECSGALFITRIAV